MNNLNSKINATLNTIVSLGFSCEYKEKMSQVLSLQSDVIYPVNDRVNLITLQYGNSILFCHISVEYFEQVDSKIKSVTYNVSDSAIYIYKAKSFAVTNSIKNIEKRINALILSKIYSPFS